MLSEIIGWIGSVAFAISAAPQAWKSFKDGHSDGITWGFLILWTIGASSCMYYVWPSAVPLISNYILSLVFSSIIIYYKMYPRGGKRVSSRKLNSRKKEGVNRGLQKL